MTHLSGLFTILKRLVLSALVLALILLSAIESVVLLVDLSERSIPASAGAAILRICATLFAVLTAIIILIIFIAIGRRLYRARLKATTLGLFGGLALAAVLFSQGVYALLVWPPWYSIRAARQLFDVNIPPLPTKTELNSISGAELIQGLASVLRGMTTSLLDTATGFWNNLPVSQVIFALALWTAIATLSLPIAGTENQPTKSRLHLWWDGIGPQQRALAGVFTALLLGIYLSVAAIIAIQWLEADTGQVQGLSREQLQRQISNSDSFLTQTASSSASDSAAFTNAINLLDSAITNGLRSFSSSTHKGIDKNKWNQYFTDLKTLLEKIKVDRNNFQEDAKHHSNTLRKRFIDITEQAGNAYERNASQQMTATERAIYFQDILNWAHSELRTISSDLDQLAEIVRRDEIAAINWAKTNRTDVDDALTRLGQPGDSTEILAPERLLHNNVPFSFFDFSRRGFAQADTPLPPNPPDPGSTWGPFAIVASWLLRTRSLPLAQIAGMLGFGLFGAAISILRWRNQGPPGPSVGVGLDNVPSVLVNGFSATLVIFLAVKGGLAVFTEGKTTPDSYVLFFACLVGAVFSEDVWTWARKQLNKALHPS